MHGRVMAVLKLVEKLRPLSNHVTKVSAVYKSTPAPSVHETGVEITDATPKPFSKMPGKLAPSSVYNL